MTSLDLRRQVFSLEPHKSRKSFYSLHQILFFRELLAPQAFLPKTPKTVTRSSVGIWFWFHLIIAKKLIASSSRIKYYNIRVNRLFLFITLKNFQFCCLTITMFTNITFLYQGEHERPQRTKTYRRLAAILIFLCKK